jgi:pyruvate dehydrogenase E1 component alpha subunit
MIPHLPRETLELALYRVLLMRRFDECVVKLWYERAFPGHYHVYFGQEATGMAAMLAAAKDDYLFTTHRNHGHLLARGADPKGMLAEILGRATGMQKGIAGTFHLADPALGFLHTSAVVGGIIPIAVGVAFGCQRKGSRQVCMALFGEGSLQEGAWHEGLIMAGTYRPPVVFLVENNDAASQVGQRQGPYNYLKTAPVDDFGDYARIHRLPAESVDGADFGAVYEAVSRALEHARRGDGPYFLETRTFRWPGQFGSWPKLVQGPARVAYAWDEAQVPADYRQWWLERDPVVRLTRELLESGVVTRERAQELEDEATRVVDEAERFAKESPWPAPESALEHVFA